MRWMSSEGLSRWSLAWAWRRQQELLLHMGKASQIQTQIWSRLTLAFSPQITTGIFILKSLNLSYFLRHTVLIWKCPPLCQVHRYHLGVFFSHCSVLNLFEIYFVSDLPFSVSSDFLFFWFTLVFIEHTVQKLPEERYLRGIFCNCTYLKTSLFDSQFLIDSLDVYRILDWNSFSLRVLKTLFHCL